MSIITWNC